MKNSTSPGVRFTTIKLTLAFSTRTLLCLTFAARIAWPALADDFRRGPLVDISDPDALAAVGSNGAAYENSIALNPANPKNIVAAWINGFGDVGCQSIVAGVSLDGGTHWQRVVIPGLTQCAGGGGFDFATDPWLSFARNGDLYLVSVNASCIPPDTCDQQHSRIAVSKSTDGGLHWWEPIVLDEGMGPGSPTDKASVTADPADARLVYATWERDFSDRIVSLFSRSTDGGQTWEPARQIYDPGVNNLVVDHQIIVLPDGTLVDYFNEFRFNETDGSYAATLSSLRSVDHGQTWSSLRRGPESASVDILDPETGHPVLSLGSFPQFVGVAVDRHNGNLYAVWEDPTFSGGQFSSVAFSMSSDGG